MNAHRYCRSAPAFSLFCYMNNAAVSEDLTDLTELDIRAAQWTDFKSGVSNSNCSEGQMKT